MLLREHKRPKTRFVPEKSINNTQQMRIHPEDREDIKYIEHELRDSLFLFENYPDIKFNGKPFYGASRKITESK